MNRGAAHAQQVRRRRRCSSSSSSNARALDPAPLRDRPEAEAAAPVEAEPHTIAGGARPAQARALRTQRKDSNAAHIKRRGGRCRRHRCAAGGGHQRRRAVERGRGRREGRAVYRRLRARPRGAVRFRAGAACGRVLSVVERLRRRCEAHGARQQQRRVRGAVVDLPPHERAVVGREAHERGVDADGVCEGRGGEDLDATKELPRPAPRSAPLPDEKGAVALQREKTIRGRVVVRRERWSSAREPERNDGLGVAREENGGSAGIVTRKRHVRILR